MRRLDDAGGSGWLGLQWEGDGAGALLADRGSHPITSRGENWNSLRLLFNQPLSGRGVCLRLPQRSRHGAIAAPTASLQYFMHCFCQGTIWARETAIVSVGETRRFHIRPKVVRTGSHRGTLSTCLMPVMPVMPAVCRGR